MSANAPPLRFLILLVGGWLCVRAAVLVPDWWSEPGVAAEIAVAAPGVERAVLPHAALPEPPMKRWTGERGAGARWPSQWRQEGLLPRPAYALIAAGPEAATSTAGPLAMSAAASRLPQPSPLFAPLHLPPRVGRWSASAWLLVREEGGRDALAPGGSLGGSQAGMRLLYRFNGDSARPLALSVRVYTPLHQPAGAEAAAGLDWRPLVGIPFHLLVERRQALGSGGRSAFAIMAYGGVSERPLSGALKLDAYAQAGMVGLRSRDAFADGSVRIGAPVGPVDLGAGAWAAAQPGAARLDVGPQLRFRLPAGRANLVVSAEYRFRIAGDAEPGSGPVLTVGTDF